LIEINKKLSDKATQSEQLTMQKPKATLKSSELTLQWNCFKNDDTRIQLFTFGSVLNNNYWGLNQVFVKAVNRPCK